MQVPEEVSEGVEVGRWQATEGHSQHVNTLADGAAPYRPQGKGGRQPCLHMHWKESA